MTIKLSVVTRNISSNDRTLIKPAVKMGDESLLLQKSL